MDNYYSYRNDGKMSTKNVSGATTKLKCYSKCETESTDQIIESKYPANLCNIDTVSNEGDRDLVGGYFFGQSKRLKLSYHSSNDPFLGNQSFTSSYDNTTSNDILAPYSNYQLFDSECNNASNSCANSNQAYQYSQPQVYNHTQQQTQNTYDVVDSSNYFAAPISLANFKPPNFHEIIRNDVKSNNQQPLSQQVSKSNDMAPINSKLFPSTTMTTTTIVATQLPPKSAHYSTHSNINNMPINQAWNDTFSWIPYTNAIDKSYNNNLFNETTTSKHTPANNNANNNTIPNFNLTTIFPDYNKS